MSERKAPLDRIHIRDLALRCIVGVNADERREKQDVVFQITLHADLARAGASDNIRDTVDYKAIKKRIVRLAEASNCFLLEKLAEEVAGLCLEDPRVARVDVSVEKPGALRFARAAAVEITRRRRRTAGR
jgi:dihydroneopterin aldolase/D-erythro-7,8-dihydroneopterin triphosphate epimerase